MSKPSPEGLLNLARTIASGARPKRVRRLGGGIGSATHAITFERRDGSLLHVVLKRYPKTNDSHAAEWKALHTVAGLGVPSPEPLAHDPEGDWFGDPALAMTKVSGKPNVDPNQIQPWVEQIAETLLTIQGAPLSSIPKQFRKTRIEKWTPPKSLKFDAFVEDVIATIQRELPWALEAERAFGHGDFHPGNLLWRATRLTGVIDWSHVAINPRAYEVSYCRADLAVLLGPRAADRFLEAYEGRLGRRLGEDLSIWDLMCGLNAIAWGHFWMIGYAEQGRVDLTVRRTKQRARAFTSRALSRLAGS